VLLGHTKMWAFEMLMETTFPESPQGRPFLLAYFPKRIRESFEDHLESHTLRREIVATAAVNHLINNTGITFLSRLMASTSEGIGEVVGAYVEADRTSGASEMRKRLQAKDLPAAQEQGALLDIEETLEALARDLLAGKKPDAKGALSAFASRHSL
jgi:glutamate dehydrogenase